MNIAELASEMCVEAAVPWAATSTCLWLVTAVAMLVAMSNLIPVDHVPPGGEVVGAAILVLEIVGMLPDIVTHYREHTVHQRAVLVGCGDDLEFATPVEHEPCPSRAKALDARIVKGGLELVERTECLLNCTAKLARGFSTAIGLHNRRYCALPYGCFPVPR